MTSGESHGDATRAALHRGCLLFDEGRFFDAHDAWEEAWRVEGGAVRLLLQGLIQVAAGFHKGLVQGRPPSMARLLDAGLRKIDAGGGLGLVELGRFRAEVEPWLEGARRWAAGGVRPDLPVPRFGPDVVREPAGQGR